MPPSANSTTNTPLPPSVEKAYYRKCIELKRRLNEVEAANDELKVRRTRQDRGILKMRLQRAYLLDHLRKMMEHTSNVDGSEGSGDEGTNEPPTDRPHRDKRTRRPPPVPPGPQPSANAHAHQPAPYGPPAVPRVPSQPEVGGTPMMMPRSGEYGGYSYPPAYEQHTPSAPPPVPHYGPHPTAQIPVSPYGPPPPGSRMNGGPLGGVNGHDTPTNRAEALGAGPAMVEHADATWGPMTYRLPHLPPPNVPETPAIRDEISRFQLALLQHQEAERRRMGPRGA